MDDLAGKISQMLSDPETLQQLKGLTGMLQKEPSAPPAAPAPQQTPSAGTGGLDLSSALSGDTMQTIMRVMPLLNEFKKEDASTRLLHALRPFLSDARKKKLDEASRMLHMMKLLPMLKGLQL